MNKLKRFIIIVLSILMVLVSVIAWTGSVVRLGILNPVVYAKLMPAINGFDSMYDGFVDYLLAELKTQEIPPEVQGVPEDLIKTAITKEDFNKTIGEFLGGTIGMLLYRQHEVDIPVKGYVDKLYDTIDNDPRVTNSETNIKATMDWIVKYKLEIFALPNADYDQTLRGLLQIVYMQNTDYWIETFFPYWGIRLSIITFSSLGLLLVLFILLMILNKERRYRSIMLAKILCIFYGMVNILVAGALYIFPNITTIFSKLAQNEKLIIAAKDLFYSFAYLALGFSILLFVAAIVLNRTQKKSYKKLPGSY